MCTCMRYYYVSVSKKQMLFWMGFGVLVLYHENVREFRRLARPTNTVVEDEIVTVPSCNERNESKTGNEPL
jgi:hypothetical protein